ncbi:integrase catalytic domain-containing protein [Trichonephila clavipes]|nr:integrase catalytic domain-containing protein [Trichonephila clavipes]
MLMYNLRKSYWILKGRKTIKEVIKTRIICKRFNAKPISVSEGLLLQVRVRDAAVFEIIGLDLAGPLILKNGEQKWILILTCALYRAIHLELLASVSTESFLLGLRRFIARRGRPPVIYSNNGTNFKGAYRLYQKMNLEKLKNVEELNPISWKFIPPQASWWGGFRERLIGLVKRTLRKTLGKTSLNHEELYTVLRDCESLINSMPLTYVTDDVEDLEPLTPAMFLQDIREVDANEGSYLPINIDHELSKPQRAAISSMQSCSSTSNGGAGLEPRAETSGHQQAETSSMQPCFSVSDGEAGVEPRLETLELPDVLISDGELQQPGPRRSRYGRLLKPRKGLNDYC